MNNEFQQPCEHCNGTGVSAWRVTGPMKDEFRPMGPFNPIEPDSAPELISEIFQIIKGDFNRKEKIERIKNECNDYLMYHPTPQPKELFTRERIIEVLRELAVRGNYVLPENEQDLEWFEEKFTGKQHQLFIDLSEIW